MRKAEMQEEILWIAEAAHVPTIWATQVLDDLAGEGALTRAEITDAAMSARAEAVMLNKGPFIIDAIALRLARTGSCAPALVPLLRGGIGQPCGPPVHCPVANVPDLTGHECCSA